MKILKIAFCLLLSTSAWASSDAIWQGNWLMGAAIGFADRDASIQTTLSYGGPGVLLTPETIVGVDYEDSGFIWGLLVGYQAINQKWLVGGEFNLDWHNFDEEHAYAFADAANILGWEATARYKRNVMMGLTSRWGYAIVPYFMPYFRLGVELGNDKIDATFENSFFYPSGINIGERTWVYRFLIGAGIEIPLLMTCGATTRVEFNFHSKGRSLEANGIIADGLFIPDVTTTMQPSEQSARIVLIWNFF